MYTTLMHNVFRMMYLKIARIRSLFMHWFVNFLEGNFHHVFGKLKQEDGSCFERCGDKLDPAYDCQCNDFCTQFGDCCPDYDEVCSGEPEPEPGSCAGKCNIGVDPDAPCQCNQSCVDFKDCCPDYNTECDGGTDPGKNFNIEIINYELYNTDLS